MADKIVITSDGTVKNTNVKINGEDMTGKYKVTDINFYAHGGYTYKSNYSNETYLNPPSVSYHVTYMDNDKRKSIALSTQKNTNTVEGYLKQKDSLIGVGREISDTVKDKILDSFDEMRENDKTIPERKVLETRTIDSIIDKYVDVVKERELQLKLEKEKK